MFFLAAMKLDDIALILEANHLQLMEMQYRMYFAEWLLIGLLSITLGVFLCRIVVLRSVV